MEGLRLLAPKGLWALALIAPLVVLYILRVRRKRAVVSSTWLWQSHARELLARSPIKKLVAQLPLLLQIAIVIACAVALAKPSSMKYEPPGAHLAIVIDVSASMSAKGEGGQARIEEAKAYAKRLVESLKPGSQAMIVVAGAEPRIASTLDRDLRRIAGVIDRVEAIDVEGDLGGAVAVAVDKMKAFEDGKVVVVTDGYLAHPLELDALAAPVDVALVGGPADNVAIVRADVRVGTARGDEREKAQCLLLVQNTGDAGREVFVTVRRPGQKEPLDARRLVAPPHEKTPVVLELPVERADYGGPLVFELSPHDQMEVDDVAYATIPPGQKLRAVIAAPDPAAASPWIARALRSDPALEVETIATADLASKNAADAGLLVVERACPSPADLASDALVFAPPKGSCLGVTVGEPAERAVATDWDDADARMRFLSFEGVSFEKLTPLTPPSPSMSLLRSKEGTLIADATTPARTATVVGFDPGETDWPLKASFVLFLRNVTELARSHRAFAPSGPARPGQGFTVALPRDAKGVSLAGPDGEKLAGTVQGGTLTSPPIERIGVYEVKVDSPRESTHAVAVSLTSPAESDLSTRATFPKREGVTVHDAGQAAPRYASVAWMLALVAIAVLVFERAYTTRRPRPRAKKGAA